MKVKTLLNMIMVLVFFIALALSTNAVNETTISDGTSAFFGLNNTGNISSDYYCNNTHSCYTVADFIVDTDTDTTYTADEGNITLVGTVFHLLRLNLAQFDNSVSGFITSATTALSNYFTKTEVIAMINGNITELRDNIEKNITGVNASMKVYVDEEITNTRTDIVNNVTNANASMKVYVDEEISGVGSASLAGLDIVNQTMLDNNTIVRSHNKTWFTDQYEAELPSCGAGEFTTSDGTDLTCDTPAGGGGGAGDKWVDSGIHISPNVTFAKNVNSSGYTVDYQINISGAGITTVEGYVINASAFYDDGVLLTPDTTIGNCSGTNCDIGWGNITSVPADIADGDDDTTYTADEGNVTLVGTVIHLLPLDLAEHINSLGWITNTVSTLTNYFTKTETIAMILANFTINNNLVTNETINRINNVTLVLSTARGDIVTNRTYLQNNIDTNRTDIQNVLRGNIDTNRTYIQGNIETNISKVFKNESSGVMTFLNVSNNLTMSNGANFAGIWHNGSGICISSC